MKTLITGLCRGLAVGGILLCGVTVHAQSSQRVFYSRESGDVVQTEAQAEPQPVAQSDSGTVVMESNCPSGNCQPGCGPGCRPTFGFRVAQFVDWFNPTGMCVHSPDHGFCPPAKRPIYRRPVSYVNYYPGQPGVQPGAYTQQQPMPAVYWPTDTTQLGYYYQTVPQWMPNRAMQPAVPNPNQWHQHACYPNCGNCEQGRLMPSGIRILGHAQTLPYPGAAGCPTCQNQGEVVTPQEKPDAVVPPAADPTPAEANLLPLNGIPALRPITR